MDVLEGKILIVKKVVESIGMTGMVTKSKINKMYKREIGSGCTPDVPDEQSIYVEKY